MRKVLFSHFRAEESEKRFKTPRLAAEQPEKTHAFFRAGPGLALGLIPFIAIAVAAGWFYVAGTPSDTYGAKNGTSTYESAEHGISFSYPDIYVLDEREAGNGEREHHVIVLMDKEAAATLPQNGEGPPTITVDIFQNNLDKLAIAEWIENDSRSNFKLSPDGVLASTTVAGTEALLYAWDGLYRGNSIVFAHKDNIVMLSVAYLSPNDAIVSDFASVVASFELH